MRKMKNQSSSTTKRDLFLTKTITNTSFIRIKLYISGSNEFALFDLPKSTMIDSLDKIISMMYNFNRNEIQLYVEKESLINYYGKTLEQLFFANENQIILIFKKNTQTFKNTKQSPSHSPSPQITKRKVNANVKNDSIQQIYNTIDSDCKKNVSTLGSVSPIANSDKTKRKYSNNSLMDESSIVSSSNKIFRTNSSVSFNSGIKKSDYLIKKDLENLKREFTILEMKQNNIDPFNYCPETLIEKIENDFMDDSQALANSLKEIKEKLDLRRNKIIAQMYKSKEKSKLLINENEESFKQLSKIINKFKEEYSFGLKIFNEFFTRFNLNDNFNHGQTSNQIKDLWEISSDLKFQLDKIIKEISEMNKLRYEHTNEYLNLFNKINTMLIKDIEDLETKPKHTFDIISTYNKELNVFSIQENSNMLYIYNASQGVTKKKISFENLGEKIKSFFWNSRTLQIKNSLYITGGHDSSNNEVRYVLYYYDDNLTELKSMTYPRWGHGLSYIAQNYIIVVSGYFNKKCEYYDIKKKAWSNLNEINYWRMDCTLFFSNNQFIYVFGGWNNYYKTTTTNNSINNYVDKIEKLKIFNNESSQILATNKWEILANIKQNLSFPQLKKCSMGIITLSLDRFYLIGGDTSDYNSDSFEDTTKAGIGASKVTLQNTILEIKINRIGGCEVEFQSHILENPTSFNLSKTFQKIDTFEYGCFSSNNRFCQIKIKNQEIIESKF